MRMIVAILLRVLTQLSPNNRPPPTPSRHSPRS